MRCVSAEMVDECATDADNCDPNAECTDTVLAFECECNEGYEGLGVLGECDGKKYTKLYSKKLRQRTRGQYFRLGKGQVGWTLESIFPERTVNAWIDCQQIVCILVVLICLRTEWTIIS